MSGTRLRSQKAQATERTARSALLVVAHGERGGAGDDRLVYEIAERIRNSGNYSTVHSCFLSKEPSLKSIVGGVSDRPVTIYPLFMSDGYFVRQAIPRSLGATHRVQVLTPVGLNGQLPQLVARTALQTARATGLVPRDCSLLLVAHGSKHDRASRNATETVAGTIRAMDEFASVSTCYLEESPFVDEQLANTKGPVLMAGLFIGQGMHGGEDVPRAIKNSRRDDVVPLPPMTRWPGLADMICSGLSETAAFQSKAHTRST